MTDNSEICKRVRSGKIEPLGKHGDVESFMKTNNLTDSQNK